MNIREIVINSLKGFDPRNEIKNPVMFITEIAFVLSIFIAAFPSSFNVPSSGVYMDFYISVTVLLFLTVFFSNLSTSLSESQSKAITESLEKMKVSTKANLLNDGKIEIVESDKLRKGDIVLVRKNEIIPADGEVIKGSGYVNESNITGESRPVLKLVGDSVTGSTMLVTDEITVRVNVNPGESFIDSMINMVKNSVRERTPNEIALSIFLSGVTLIFLIVVASIFSISNYSGVRPNIDILIVLLIALIPTTIGGLLPAIGIAAINKVSQYNIIAKSGKAVENAGDIDTIILDKTGTITMGEREAVKFYPNMNVDERDVARAALMSSLNDETIEGISIVRLARSENIDVNDDEIKDYEFIPFSSETGFSGIRKGDHYIYKGSLRSLSEKLNLQDQYINGICKQISLKGGTAIPVASDGKFLGVIELNDILKPGIKDRINDLHKMNIETVMLTGDDEVTAAYFAREAGIDDFIANSKPQDKYNRVVMEKERERMVAMIGDGTNDAPALSKADVAMAMNTGTQAAKDAANMIDLDSTPTKLIDVIFLGKQILITRGSLTTFSIANDISKYFVIIPAMFYMFPELGFLNILDLTDPLRAITAALIFNTIIIVILVPLALRGVKYSPSSASDLLKRNIIIYGFGGIVFPFIVIYIIYLLLSLGGIAW
ncbi:potassium-transporting ATPase subunit KdpB [Acidiplasma sp.]|uniref:potassium-transporting ATPase subunit KdpB n=1 Tax=Acidiplasma sp. TaxID=1872114 RepID=UPI002582D4C6|nr:potassium-transporting ATPase subunit KdpB [Acidiplasma sp.]